MAEGRPYGLYLDGEYAGRIELTEADVIAVLLRQETRKAFLAGVGLGAKMPALKEGYAAADAHAEEVVQRWRSASSDKP